MFERKVSQRNTGKQNEIGVFFPLFSFSSARGAGEGDKKKQKMRKKQNKQHNSQNN